MANIIPFEFETQALRVNLDDAGQPWFNANDLCAVLDFGNPRQALESHVDGDDVQKLDTIDNLGRAQRANHVNESGLYALILGSTKEAAKRFKRWVTSDVLPSLRKAGAYAMSGSIATLPSPTQDRVTSLLLIGEAIAKVPGVKPGIAMAATLTCIQENTGLGMETLRRALPAANESQGSLNPTQIGEQTGLRAQAVNLRLRDLGLQFKNDRGEWELTEPGQAHGEAVPYSRHGHAGYQILWKSEVVELLKEAA